LREVQNCADARTGRRGYRQYILDSWTDWYERLDRLWSGQAWDRTDLIELIKVAAIEYATKGIRVNAVCPGAVSSPMTDRLMGQEPGRREMYMAMQLVERFGSQDEIAETVVWLCSDGASFVTGHAIPVYGGYVAQ
jgi:hypothetical protein